MKAIVVHEYGGPEVLRFEEHADPVIKPSEVLVKVVAAGINPIDLKRRSGEMKDLFPIQFPGILGADFAATIAQVGSGVEGWKTGDKVFAMADQTYAEFCAVPASVLARAPEGLDPVEAAALPVVVTTGFQLISEAAVRTGQIVLVTGAAGSVGRSAVFAAKERGAIVIAAVRKKQLDVAKNLGADSVVATDDEGAIAKLSPLDVVADTIAGKTAENLLRKVKSGGAFVSTVVPPANAKDFPAVKSSAIDAQPDAGTLRHVVDAVRNGKFQIPVGRTFPLREAAAAHAAIEAGLSGKVLLIA